MSTAGNDTTTDWEMMSNDSEPGSGDSSDTRARGVSRSPARKTRRVLDSSDGSENESMSDDDDIAGPLVTERKQVRQQYLDGKAYPPYKQPGSQQPGHRKPRDDEFVVCGQGGAHSYVDGTAKTWPNGGPAGNGLFYWPRNKLSELCCMLVKTRWHMDVRVNGRFNFVADFDDKDGKFADYLDAGVMQRTMEAALRKFFDTEDIDVVSMPRQDDKGYHIWASVVIDMQPGWSRLCKAVVSAWKGELDAEQLDFADENTFALGAGNALDDDIYKESAAHSFISLRPPFVQKNHSLSDETAYVPSNLNSLLETMPYTAIMRKLVGFAPDGATPTPLTELGTQSLATTQSGTGPQSSEEVTEHTNNFLGTVVDCVPDGLEHLYSESSTDGSKCVMIHNNRGLCYAHAALDGSVHYHTDNHRQSMMIFTNTKITAKCFSHGDVSLTRRKDLKLVKLLVMATPSGDGDINIADRMNSGHELTALITGLLNSYAQENGLQKEGDCVVWPTHDGFDYAHKEPKKPEDYNTFIDNVANATPDLRKMLNSDMGLRKKLKSFLEDTNDPLFPKLERDMCIYGCRDGIVVQSAEDVQVTRLLTMKQPKLTFISWGDVKQQIDAGEREQFVVRVFIDQGYDPAWAGMTSDEMCAAEWEDGDPVSGCCPFLIKSFRDQGFDTNVQTFKVQGRSQDWSIMKLVIASLHRILYATGAYDDYAFITWFYGRSRTGKTLATDIVKYAYYQPSMVMQVTNSNEDVFGLQAAVGKALISMPDIKRKAARTPFPLSESNLQTIIEGGSISIARKNLSALSNAIIDAPPLVDGNKKVGQIWDDEANAMNNRVATFEYNKKPTDRRSDLKKKTGPIHTHETLAFLFLGNKCYRELLSHARHSTFVDWNIPYFMDERALIEKQNNHLLRFITLPRGEMGTKDSDIWCVFDAGAEASVRDLKRRFGAWMRFDNDMDASWENVSLEETLEKASEEHDGVFTLKEPSHYYKCNACKQPVDCNMNTLLPYAPHCCQVYADNAAPMSIKAARTIHNKASKKEAQVIVGLRINEAPKSGGTQSRLPQQAVPADWRWNGKCGCGHDALQRTSAAGVDYYCCFFGAVDDARCNLTYKPMAELDPVRAQGGGSNYP